MVCCAVAGCLSNNNKKRKSCSNCRYFTFPREKQLCDEWILKCNQKHEFNVKTARICSKHFVESDYCLKERWLKLPENKWKLKSSAIPSLCLTPPTDGQTSPQPKCTKRKQKEPNSESKIKKVIQEPNDKTQNKVGGNLQEKFKTVSTQTSETSLVKEVKFLQAENLRLKELLQQERKERTIEHFTTSKLHEWLACKQKDC